MQVVKPFAYVSTFIASCWGCIDYGKFYSHIHGAPVLEGNENKVLFLTNMQNLLVYIYNFQIFDFFRILINNVSETLGVAYKFITITVMILVISFILWIPYRIYRFWKKGKIEEDYVKEYENTFWKLIKEAFGIDNKIVDLKIQEENIRAQSENLKKNEEDVKQLKQDIHKDLEEKLEGWKAKAQLLKRDLVIEREKAEEKIKEAGKDLLSIISKRDEELQILQENNDRKIVNVQEAHSKQIAKLKESHQEEIAKLQKELVDLKQLNFDTFTKKFSELKTKKKKEIVTADDLDD